MKALGMHTVKNANSTIDKKVIWMCELLKAKA